MVDMLLALVGPVDMEDLHFFIALFPFVGDDEARRVMFGIEVKSRRD